jgi:hypothetical protein
MAKFISLLKTLVFESVTQYSRSLDSSIKKLPKEFEDFYNLKFESYLNNPGSKEFLDTKKGINLFSQYCMRDDVTEGMLYEFLTYANIGLEESKIEDIIVPLGGNKLEKIDNIFASGTIHPDTQAIVRKSLNNHEKNRRKKIAEAAADKSVQMSRLERKLVNNEITREAFKKESKRLTEKLEMAESAANKDYQAAIQDEISNLTKPKNDSKQLSKQVKSLMLEIINTIIIRKREKIIKDKLALQNELLRSKDKEFKIEVDESEIPIDTNDPVVNIARMNWNNVISQLKNINLYSIDKASERKVLENIKATDKNKDLFIPFLPLFMNPDISDITIEQYNDIFEKSFLNKLNTARLKPYINAMKENKSRKKELIIQKIFSVLRKKPSDLNIGSEVITGTITGVKSNTPIQAKKEEISQDEINKILESIDRISVKDIIGSFENGLFGSTERKMTETIKGINKIKLLSDLITKQNYIQKIKNAIDDFESRMLLAKDEIETYLLTKEENGESLNSADKRLLSNIDGYDGVTYRIKLDEIKNELDNLI